jgi:hypothetical protein
VITWFHFSWAFDEAEHHGGQHMEIEVVHLLTARKQRQRGRDQGTNIPFKVAASVAYFFLNFPPTPNGPWSYDSTNGLPQR